MKAERLELRLSHDEKELFRRAQKISGESNLSSFIVSRVKSVCYDVIERETRILEGERDRRIFFDAIFDQPRPNDKLAELLNTD